MTMRQDDAKFTPILARLRDAALAYPEAVEEFPWGDRVAKVRGKIFVFLNTHEGKLVVTAKLPQSGEAALMLPFAEATGYNLGKSGWVTARFGPKDRVPEAMLLEWIEESYRAVAPKRALQSLDGAAPTPGRPGKPIKTSAPAARAAASQREAHATAAAAGKAAAEKGTPAKKAVAKKGAPAKKVAAAKGTPAKKAVAKKGSPAKKAVAEKGTPAKKAAAKKGAPAKKAVEKESRRSP
ncbi:MmcQ/YjbR family DNA-binding protein [Sorangium sp. So ce128]|uniref:MmcQ/YjbR family DNA-binding protein n=1 Tax=Sorangium sp. So ce128 TaxID=3133281 RepID=UPI003F5F17E3